MSVTESSEDNSIYSFDEEDNTFLNLPSNASITTISLYLSYAYSKTQIAFSIETPIINSNRISINHLLEAIANYITLSEYSISYNDDGSDVYLSIGSAPLKQNYLCELTPNQTIWIKLRQNTNTSRMIQQDFIGEDDEDNEHMNSFGFDNKKTNYFINTKSKRAKERTIVEIINKLYLWKRLYQGITDKKGKHVKLTSQEAAEYTEISHKSLDEYFNQLKIGMMFGFDFNKHKHDKFGVLRGFIKNKTKDVDPGVIKQIKSKKKKKNYYFKIKTMDNTTATEIGEEGDKEDEEWQEYKKNFVDFDMDLNMNMEMKNGCNENNLPESFFGDYTFNDQSLIQDLF